MRSGLLVIACVAVLDKSCLFQYWELTGFALETELKETMNTHKHKCTCSGIVPHLR